MRAIQAVVLVAALTLAACGDSSTGEESEATPNTSSEPTNPTPTTQAPVTTEAVPTTTTEAPATTESESGEGALGDLGGFSPFGPGTYTMQYLGVPVTFTVDEDWSTQPVGSGFFVITMPDSRGPGDHDIVFMRPSAVFDADTREPSLAADDLDGWLATVPDTVSMSEPAPTTVAGFDALTFEATVEVGSVPLVVAGTGPDQIVKSVVQGFLFEVWWIDLEDGPPIVIVVGTTQEDPDWLDIASDVVATLKIG